MILEQATVLDVYINPMGHAFNFHLKLVYKKIRSGSKRMISNRFPSILIYSIYSSNKQSIVPTKGTHNFRKQQQKPKTDIISST